MWLSKTQATALVAEHGTPLFVYSKEALGEQVAALQSLTLPFGLTVRYAVKANPYPEIIALFNSEGMHFDASSSHEATELLQQGIAGDKISLSSQQSAHNLGQLLSAGVRYVATSLHQLELFAAAAQPGAQVAIRANPPLKGAGHNNRTSTGGVASSFGLWHEYTGKALAFAKSRDITIDRLHVHIGSGADPVVWGQAIGIALNITQQLPDVTTLDIGGGYKVARAHDEPETDMRQVAEVFAEHLQKFAHRTGRQLHLEIEPGTWLVAHAGMLLAQVDDIVDTGAKGYTFLRLNTGMNDIIRPAMYGAQHNIAVLNGAKEMVDYVVVGHNCETGDILTPASGNPELLAPRRLHRAAIGDLVAIGDAGAYCASFSAKHYNAFPSAREVLI